jgi:hypothetical protein
MGPLSRYVLLPSRLLLLVAAASGCHGSTKDVEVGEKALRPLGFEVEHGAPGIRSGFGLALDGFQSLNEATPKQVKAMTVSVSCDALSDMAQNHQFPSTSQVLGWITGDLAIDAASLTPSEKFELATDLQRVWAQALVNQNDVIPDSTVSEATQSLRCSGVAG